LLLHDLNVDSFVDQVALMVLLQLLLLGLLDMDVVTVQRCGLILDVDLFVENMLLLHGLIVESTLLLLRALSLWLFLQSKWILRERRVDSSVKMLDESFLRR
jgi:hypothetical protein